VNDHDSDGWLDDEWGKPAERLRRALPENRRTPRRWGRRVVDTSSPDREVLFDWWRAELAVVRKHEATARLLEAVRWLTLSFAVAGLVAAAVLVRELFQ
jgi:hypothetical protein